MMRTRTFLAIFIPAILLGGLGLFIQIVRYQPLNPPANASTASTQTPIPIFPDDPILGKATAPTHLIVFADFGCPGCKQEMDVLGTLLARYPSSVQIIWKGLPVTRIPYPTDRAHLYAFCLNQQGKFSAFKNAAFANGDNLDEPTLQTIVSTIGADQKKIDACLASGAADAYQTQMTALATALNIQSVPTVFLNNAQIEPPTTLAGWEVLLKLPPSS